MVLRARHCKPESTAVGAGAIVGRKISVEGDLAHDAPGQHLKRGAGEAPDGNSCFGKEKSMRRYNVQDRFGTKVDQDNLFVQQKAKAEAKASPERVRGHER